MLKPQYEDLLGIPFEFYARGPQSYDCYGFLMRVYKDFNGVQIPDYGSNHEVEKIALLFAHGIQEWVEVEPKEGVAVLMRVSGYGAHVGYCVGDGLFMHTWEQSAGVVIERLDTWKHRIMGFYDYAGS